MSKTFTVLAAVLFAVSVAMAGDLHHLELKKASAGDLLALEKAFIQLKSSDGANAEDIEIAIGKSITKSPRHFLEALKRQQSDAINLNGLLNNLGEEFVDEYALQEREIKKRIASLKGVSHVSTKLLASQCVRILKTQLKDIQKIQKK